jgi:8-oxo-dGTP pyrophosphatase MutT (NUDIX family)
MDGRWEAGEFGGDGLVERLREAVARPFDAWREVYESFSPVDLKTGERRPRVPPPGANSRRAAVLVPILMDNGQARVVYTVRKGDLADHAGQISFPGGSAESTDDSLMETALREAEEEIDLSPSLVEVIGELEEMYIPPSNFRVSPFVGLLPPEAESSRCPSKRLPPPRRCAGCPGTTRATTTRYRFLPSVAHPRATSGARRRR